MYNQKQSNLIIRLTSNPVKNYHWGSIHQNSLVRSLARPHDLSHTPYAELWMGVHPNGQSFCANGQSLSQYLQSNKYSEPSFLFKVLSIQKCLSIQMHPNEDQAKYLHNKNPSQYKDNNSKPELFVVLSESFECFLGFISEELHKKIITDKAFEKVLKNKNLTVPQTLISILELSPTDLQYLMGTFNDIAQKYYPQRAYLYLRLQKQFPQDIGLLLSLFLHYKRLKRYQSFFIDANVPHAYISGDCLEIMKNSDNVVRLGLTPKFKDLQDIRTLLLSPTSSGIQINLPKNAQSILQYAYGGLKIEVIISANGQELKMEKECRIGIVIRGIFQLKKDGHEKEQFKVGDVMLLESEQKYQVWGEGQLCIGSSSFE